jgi:uncharacterized protein (TIGR00159 family)
MIEALFAWLHVLWTTLSADYHLFWDTLDILLVAAAVYWLLLLIKGTRAAQMTLGLLVLVLLYLLIERLELPTLGLLLDNFFRWGVLIVIVIFQADIRRALSRVGKGFFTAGPRQKALAIEEVVRACQSLAQRRVGSLIVIERELSLEEYLELGTGLDAELTRDLLIAIFLPYSPLHDGAVLIRQSRIAAAGCILPLALRNNLPSTLGTRHRAAIGIAEETDAIAVVVSEETGRMSLVVGGEISEDLEGSMLRQALLRLMGDVRREGVEAGEATAESARLPQESS